MEENDVIEAETVTADENETPEQNEPETMLEAIQEGLKTDEPEKKEETPEEPEAEPEAPHEDDETPPEGISKKAQERFQRLVGKVKEKDEVISQLQSDLDGIRTYMKDTKASPEDFAMAFDYLKALNSGDMRAVGRMLQEQIKQYQLATGVQLEMADPLADFPDLRHRVDGYQMTEEAALEIARMRAYQREQQEMQQRSYRQQQDQHQAMQARNAALSDIDRLGAEWSKKDPDYAAKESIILKQIPRIAQTFPPQQWANQVAILYETISNVPMQKQQVVPAPLRSSGQSAGAKEPKNLMEALQAGLGYSNG